MSNEKKDLLFIVPDQHYVRYRRVIRHVLFAVKSTATYDVVSGYEFGRLYSDRPVDEVYRELESKYIEAGYFGDLSKKEAKIVNAIMAAWIDYVNAGTGAEGEASDDRP